MHTLEEFVKRNRSLFPDDIIIYQNVKFFRLNDEELRRIGERPDAEVGLRYDQSDLHRATAAHFHATVPYSGGSRRSCWGGIGGLGLCPQRGCRGTETPPSRSRSINAFCVLVRAFS